MQNVPQAAAARAAETTAQPSRAEEKARGPAVVGSRCFLEETVCHSR